MDLHEHAIISGVGAAGVGLATGDWVAASAYFTVGVFIDLDHLADYWREDGFNLNLRRFLGFFDARLPQRQWLFLHGWEWAGSAFALSFSPWAPAWAYWAALGWLSHLLLDHCTNDLKPLAYFYFWRARHGFASKTLYA